MMTTRRELLRKAVASGLGVGLLNGPVLAAPAPAQAQGHGSLADKINANTIMILTAGSGLTFAPMAADLATVLNDGDNFRVLPVQGHSAYQNVRDVRYLRGVDMGFTRSNILGHWRKSGEIPDVADKISYIVNVGNEEENLIVRSDITSMEQLRGKKVNFNQVGSGTQMSARDIFNAFKIDIEETNLREGDAFEKLKNGEITAMVATAGKPSPTIRRLKRSEGWRLVPIPLKDSLIGDYIPSTLDHKDYPDLIAEGESVDTLASSIVIICYNWPKNSDHYRRIDHFVNVFFPRLAEFQKPPRHEKWQETVLTASITGWKRFEGAEEWLKANREQQVAANREQFDQFLANHEAPFNGKTMSQADRDRLFDDFLKWRQLGAAH